MQAVACAHCGNNFSAGEQFCGQCGSPRSGAPIMQSKAASSLRMQETAGEVSLREKSPGAAERSTLELAAAAAPEADLFRDTATHISPPDLAGESLAALEAQMPELFTPYEAPR